MAARNAEPAHVGEQFHAGSGTRLAAIGRYKPVLSRSDASSGQWDATGQSPAGEEMIEMIEGCSAAKGSFGVETSDDGAGSGSTAVTRIIISESPRPGPGSGGRGCRYDVHFDTGELLLGKSDEPIYDACRQLAARGVTGRLEVWRAGKRHADVIVRDIVRAGGWTIEETAKVGPRFRRHRPMTATAFSARFAIAA